MTERSGGLRGRDALPEALTEGAHAPGARWERRADAALGVAASAILFCMMTLTFVDVVLRYVFNRPLRFVNTNGLVRNSRWDIELSKTGYISEAGRCLVMQVRVASKDLIVVLLDSWGKQSRIGDAQRIRQWLEKSATRT